MTSTKKFNSELYDRLHPISRPINIPNANPCSITNQIGQLRYHHIYLCRHHHQLLNVHHCHHHPHPGPHDPGLEEPGHHHTILFCISHLSEPIHFLQACMLWVKEKQLFSILQLQNWLFWSCSSSSSILFYALDYI